jgi:hypothetical protein
MARMVGTAGSRALGDKPWEAIQDEATLTSSSTLLQPVLQHLQARHIRRV